MEVNVTSARGKHEWFDDLWRSQNSDIERPIVTGGGLLVKEGVEAEAVETKDVKEESFGAELDDVTFPTYLGRRLVPVPTTAATPNKAELESKTKEAYISRALRFEAIHALVYEYGESYDKDSQEYEKRFGLFSITECADYAAVVTSSGKKIEELAWGNETEKSVLRTGFSKECLSAWEEIKKQKARIAALENSADVDKENKR